jgi:hypothetical protein
MTIGKPKRQPCRLLSLADENLVVSINRLDFGFRHPIAFALVARSLRNYTISCRTIEPSHGPSHEAKTHFAAPQSAAALTVFCKNSFAAHYLVRNSVEFP